jgi:methionine sulfoxide reductase heme-binding subunit
MQTTPSTIADAGNQATGPVNVATGTATDRTAAATDRVVPGSGPRRRSGATARLSGRSSVVAIAIVGLVIILATDQVVPAASEHQARLRIWLASRAAGVLTLVLLAFQIVVGLVLSHPVNKTTWKLSKRLFPWHENVWLFVLAFLAVHIVSIVLDPFAGVGLGGAFIPGLSSYRSMPVAIGTLALYALLLTGVTARYTKLLPPGAWLTIHRVGIVVFVLGWMHGLLAGTDSIALVTLYAVLACAVGGAAAYRYWVTRQGRPTFATSLSEGSR